MTKETSKALRIRRDPQADILAVLRFKNLHLYNLLAGRTIKQVAEAAGLSYQLVGRLLNLRDSPFLEKTGEYRSTAIKLAEFFGVNAADLFPGFLRELTVPRQLEAEMRGEQLVSLGEVRSIPVLPQDTVSTEEMRKRIDAALATLPPRTQRVMIERFGLDGQGYTLDEVGEHFSVSRGRVRQIEAKGLRLLRHPSVNKGLRECLENAPESRYARPVRQETPENIKAYFFCKKCKVVFSLSDVLTPDEVFATIRCRYGHLLKRVNFVEWCPLKPEYCNDCGHHVSAHDKYKLCSRCSRCFHFQEGAFPASKEWVGYYGVNRGNAALRWAQKIAEMHPGVKRAKKAWPQQRPVFKVQTPA